MRAFSIEAQELIVPLKEPLSISFHTFHAYENFIVRVALDEGRLGVGEGSPFKAITGDSIEEALEEVSAVRRRLPLEVKSLENIDRAISGVNSQTLRCAFDMALHDGLSHSKNIPLFKLYSEKPKPVPNSVTVFLKETVEETKNEVQRILELYPALTILKIKLKGRDDIERCKIIKSTVPDAMQFVLDANQAFKDVKEGERVLTEIGAILKKVLLVEEPCARRSYSDLKFLHDNIDIPIFADESCSNEEDLKRLIHERCVSGINIKLQKAGGIRAAKRLASMAAVNNLSIMVGQMFETAISTAAGLHFAFSTEGVLLTDLDMDLDLPARHRMPGKYKGGSRTLPEGEGLGI